MGGSCGSALSCSLEWGSVHAACYASSVVGVVVTVRLGTVARVQWEREKRGAFAEAANLFIQTGGAPCSGSDISRLESLAGGNDRLTAWVILKTREVARVFPAPVPPWEKGEDPAAAAARAIDRALSGSR